MINPESITTARAILTRLSKDKPRMRDRFNRDMKIILSFGCQCRYHRYCTLSEMTANVDIANDAAEASRITVQAGR